MIFLYIIVYFTIQIEMSEIFPLKYSLDDFPENIRKNPHIQSITENNFILKNIKENELYDCIVIHEFLQINNSELLDEFLFAFRNDDTYIGINMNKVIFNDIILRNYYFSIHKHLPIHPVQIYKDNNIENIIKYNMRRLFPDNKLLITEVAAKVNNISIFKEYFSTRDNTFIKLLCNVAIKYNNVDILKIINPCNDFIYENEDEFFDIAAMNDSNDVLQWFIDEGFSYKFEFIENILYIRKNYAGIKLIIHDTNEYFKDKILDNDDVDSWIILKNYMDININDIIIYDDVNIFCEFIKINNYIITNNDINDTIFHGSIKIFKIIMKYIQLNDVIVQTIYDTYLSDEIIEFLNEECDFKNYDKSNIVF